MKKKGLLNSYKRVLLLAILSCVVIVVAIVSFSLSWFTTERELDMMTMIKTPIVLELKSGNKHDIVHLDMGNIDVESGEYSKSYVFCVYGEPLDYYSLQLAYTTNIGFKYSVYRADYVADSSNYHESDVVFTYSDENGEHAEHFRKTAEAGHSSPVIDTDVSYDVLDSHKQSEITYKTENNVYEKVQNNAQPLYWLAQENGLTSMEPINKIYAQFYDYYILTVSWDNGVTNSKETDMVYISVSF